jgi:uncharacterized protein (TIGR02271 family)
MAGKKRSTSAARPEDAERAEEVAAIPLVEERLSVAKRLVESGRVKVHVSVEERQETVTEELLHDELEVERVPRNVRVSELPHVRLEGNTTIIPVVEEVLVVERALMLVEEIHICRRSVAEQTQIPMAVRAEKATIQREPADEPSSAE